MFLLSRAVAARENATNNPSPPTLSSATMADKPTTASAPVDKNKVPVKKDIKKSLKGVVVKKKPKGTATEFPPANGKRAAGKNPKVEEVTKRRKLDSKP